MRSKDGAIIADPTQITLGGVRVSNPTEEQLVAAGYLPYVSPAPAVNADPLAARRAAIVGQVRALLTALGMPEERWPADFDAAIAAMKAIPDKDMAMQAGLELLALRTALVETGGTWAMVLQTGLADGGVLLTAGMREP